MVICADNVVQSYLSYSETYDMISDGEVFYGFSFVSAVRYLLASEDGISVGCREQNELLNWNEREIV